MSMEIRNVKLSHIDKDINMIVPSGLVYISGKNGAGKTLLLDLIAGLEKLKKGEIVGNENVIYINQSTYFSDKLRVKNLLEFTYFLDGCKRNKEHFIQFAQNTLDKGQIEKLDSLLEKRWGVLSGGERKYIYALIVLSIPKEWYIMDEPFAYIDEEKKKILIDIIKLRLKEGKNIILTSHEYIEEMNALEPKTINIDQ